MSKLVLVPMDYMERVQQVRTLERQQQLISKLGKLSVTAEAGAYKFELQAEESKELKDFIVSMIQRRINKLNT